MSERSERTNVTALRNHVTVHCGSPSAARECGDRSRPGGGAGRRRPCRCRARHHGARLPGDRRADDLPDAPDPEPVSWPAGAATGVGSLPGTDVTEAAATVVGELPLLPHLPELPARGVGADMIGRTAALLVDLAVEVVPSGWRVTARPGRDHRRAQDLLRFDVDALDAACAGPRPEWVKVQAAGPWTLAAAVELHTGHRVLTDRGAVREFAGSLGEGLRAHVTEVAERTGARVLVQLDEPSLPAVLAGTLPTASGWGTVRSVSAQDAQDLLRDLVAGLGAPVVVHCCAPNPPVRLLAAVGVAGMGIDATLPVFSGPTALPAALDALGEVWDAGIPLLLGLVPALPPSRTRPAPDSSRAAGGASRRGDSASPDVDDRGSDDLGAPSACAPWLAGRSIWPTASASTDPASASSPSRPRRAVWPAPRRPGLAARWSSPVSWAGRSWTRRNLVIAAA